MDFLIKFQLNIFAFLVLISVYIIICIRSKITNLSCKLLKYTIFATASALIIEPLTWIFDGTSFFGSYFLEYSTNFLLILIAPVICGLMLSYVDYHLFKDRNRVFKKQFYMHFFLFTLVILIINIFYPIYFEVNPNTNSYSPGDFLWIHTVIITLFYIYMLILTVINRKKTTKYALIIFGFFFSLPIIGMIVQLFEIDVFFSWSSIALSILVVYIFIESSNGETDYLTRIFTRMSYEKHINYLIERKNNFEIIYIDLDKFKQINDLKGHLKGDEILVEFSKYLERAFFPNKMISRLGGDEFMVVDESNLDITQAVNDLYSLIKSSEDPNMQKLKFSYGNIKYKEGMSLDDLYNQADVKMYKNKNKTS
ncbi:GGDEF domain-containing protein [Candidatus Izemoplasma sp. B36]|uniref:GGDEF domain-containing protein n=1 Tax=Candidatus Izemoplasma sp. B36 TaxID=3242468 RepID=UPI003558EBD3